ncbi:secreted transmembrane protein [Psychroflexus torquis ATCC 700755]|uniref:Secreted transmembrane protein n=1 Tax=Psychroflexus torquis (strain ATCC 700755 / CIP 106069 / ACAM 623) TaxID=313595 RepID=K4IH39_PSYTT|nr:hypothetical protein [Psychroflexus torquis]AFU69674.1 secreted transmembrane protein [Psychroflexus torquis ATCC 700755]
MKQTKRLKLSRWQTIDHYFIVIFILLIPGLTLFSLFEIYVTDSYDGVRSADELISTTWPWLIPAIVFYFIQKRRLRFREVKVEHTDQEFYEAIERTAKEYEWQIEPNNKNIFRAYRPWNWPGSWGEMITIIKDKDRLLLNSICDPNKLSSVASFGWNKRNIDTFLKNLVDLKKDIPLQEKTEKAEKEWTLKKFLIRFFAYPFCLFLIGFGIYMIFNPVNWKSAGAGIGAMAIASTYLYSDLKTIIKKKHERVTKN